MHRRDGERDSERDDARLGFAPGDAGLCFVGPLYELCAIGLCRPALEAFCAGARSVESAVSFLTETDASVSFPSPSPLPSPRPHGHPHVAPVIDRAYLLKILAEEVGRQFGHPLRPIVELVLNAVDASASAQRPTVEVIVEDGHVDVLDEGDGMSLRTVLSRLLIPFATDKRPGVDLGRFGVGFFSVLSFGLAHPEGFALQLTTGEGSDGWVMRVIAGGPDPTALLCSVRRVSPHRGTRVRVSSPLLHADAVRAYLRETLHFFPAERAIVCVDGVSINDGSLISGGQLLNDTPLGRTPPASSPSGRFHMGGRGLCASISAATFHAGVKVEPCLAVAELALLDFPDAVELTEGRDALKPGPALDAMASAFYRRLVRYAENSGADRATRDRLAEVAAQISALMLRSAGWSHSAVELATALLGPERYLVTPDRREPVLGFFGPAITERLFVPESFWAERQWQPHLPGERELLERELTIQPPESLATAARRRPDLTGLAMLAARTSTSSTTQIALCRPAPRALAPIDEGAPSPGLRPPLCAPPDDLVTAAGPLPCLATRRFILIREDSPALRDPGGWRGWYALRAAFDRAAGLREPEFERDLIVGEALGTHGPGLVRPEEHAPHPAGVHIPRPGVIVAGGAR
ncbi:ATP-binding protein [Chondromyces crocatus]|uniref:Uncharacterized protein n=1 Tax=Chondromyces crocatus TaxID=52 RepID=A0A0K1EA05_CHOCO|nr:ATP-binding protein [Chondromyces crocatus]AKT37695.1 uncharacterized protein CMC5_018370 [Chondromyces crocatus]